MGQLPLDSIRVVDTAMVYAGPTCGRILAELGADVIKVESIQRPEGMRMDRFIDNNPGVRPWHRGGYFMKRNLGKRGITLNLTDPRAQDLYKRLVAKSDVVLESYTPRVMKNFGLDYDALREVNPSLVMISLSGFGQDGPYRDYTAYGMGLEPMSGLSSLTGYPDSEPRRTGMSYTDPLAGTMGALAVLFALEHRRKTGEGQYIDLAQWEASIPFLGEEILAAQITGRPAPRTANRRPDMAPHGVYPCLGDDRWVSIAVPSDAAWLRLCGALGRDDWATNPNLATLDGRKAHEDEIEAGIRAWTATRTVADATAALQAAAVPAGPVNRSDDVIFDPHLADRGFFEVIDQPEAGIRPFPRQLVARYSSIDAGVTRPAPMLGEHNEEVLQEILGVSDDEYAELLADEVIGDTPMIQRPTAPMRLDIHLRHNALATLDPDYLDKLAAHFHIDPRRIVDPTGVGEPARSAAQS